MVADNWVTRVFLSEVETQCRLALIARADAEAAIQQLLRGEHDASFDSLRIWYSIQAFLSACANVSKLLWPKLTRSKGETDVHVRRRRERGEQLRRALDIVDDSPLSELKGKRLRNYFEHFDERLDDWAVTSPNYILMSRCSGTPGSFMIAGMGPSDTMGYLDLTTHHVTFQDLVISLPKMYAAIEHLYRRIDTIGS